MIYIEIITLATTQFILREHPKAPVVHEKLTNQFLVYLHEILIKILAIKRKYPHNQHMNTLSYEKFDSHLKAGHVYRREALLSLSSAIDRDLSSLVKKGRIERVGSGLYHKPAHSRFGTLPSNDEELVRSFLRDDYFLLFSWNQYNTLGLGLTQLYNRVVVYNRKRHGLFKLGGKEFDFRRPARGFPEKLSKEFLLIDLINNLSELAEEGELVKAQVKKYLKQFNQSKVTHYASLYGKVATRKFFEHIK